MRGEGRARRAGFLAPDFLAVLLENVLGFRAQQRDLFFGEAIGEEDVALLVEGPSCSALSFMVALPDECGRCSGSLTAILVRAPQNATGLRDAAFVHGAAQQEGESNEHRPELPTESASPAETERATIGTIHNAAKIVFSQGAKPRVIPSAARKAMAGASSMRS